MSGMNPGHEDDKLRELVTSDTGFYLLAEAMPQIVWVTRADGWNVYVNRQWVDYTGLTLDESYGHGWNKPFHPDDRQRAWDAWRNAVENNATYSLECRLRKADGTFRWWLIRGVPVINESGVIDKWIGTCTDIHDLKTSQEDSDTAKNRLEAALRSMGDALFIVDAEGRLVEFNEAFLTYHRFKCGQEYPRTVGECSKILEAYTTDGESIPVEQWATSRALRGETGRNVDYLLRRKDTGESWVGSCSFAPIRDADGMIGGAVVVARDITERKRAEESLQEHARQLAESQRIGLIGSWSCELDGRLRWTDETFRLFGVSPAKFPQNAEAFLQLIHPEDRQKLETSMQACLSGKQPDPVMYRRILPDGSLRYLTGRGELQRDADGSPQRMIGTVQDITEQVRAHEALRASERQLRLAVEGSHMGVFTWDLASNRTVWNTQGELLWGYAPGEYDGSYEAFASRVHPHDLPGLEAEVARSREARDRYWHEYRVLWPDGSVHWLVGRGEFLYGDDGEPLQMNGTVVEVTRRKQAEADLHFTQELLNKIVTSAPSSIFAMDRQHRFTLTNPAHCQLLSVSEAQVLGHREREFFPAATADRLWADNEAILQTACILELEEELQRPDGSHRTVVTSKFPLRDEQGEIIGLGGVATDISARKEVESALARYREDLEQQVRLRTHELVAQKAVLSTSEERFRYAMEATREGVWDWEPQGDNLYLSPAYRRLLGVQDEASAAEFLRAWDTYVHPEDLETASVSALRHACDDSDHFEREFRLGIPGGTERWFVSRGRVFQRDGAGAAIRIVGTLADVTERRRRNAELEATNRLLKAIIDTVPLRVFWKDCDLRYLGCNTQFAHDAGKSAPEELLGQDDYAMGWKDQAEQYRADDWEVIQSARARLDYEELLLTPDGRAIWLQTSKVPLRSQNGEVIGVLGVYNDITERKRDESALRDSEARYRTVFENANDALLIMRDGCFVECNARTLDIYGCTRSQIIGARPEQFSPSNQPDGQDSAFRARALIAAAEAGRPQRFEWRHTRGDGSEFDAEVSLNAFKVGEEILVHAIVRDITQRKEAEAALRESENRFRSLFLDMTQGVLYVSGDGGLLDINPAGCRLLGLEREAFLATTSDSPDWDVVDGSGEALSPDSHPVLAALRSGQRVLDELLGVRNFITGEYVWLRVSAIPEFRPGEIHPFRAFVTLHDVTASRQATLALKESEQRLIALLQQAADGIVLIDMETMRFSVFNEAACAQLGYSREEFQDLDLPRVNPDMSKATMRDRFEELRSQGVLDFETTHRHKDGHARNMRVTNRLVRTGGRDYAVAIWSDITEQKRQQALLYEALAFLHETQRIAKVGGWKANPVTNLLVWTAEVYELVEHPAESAPSSFEEGLQYYAPDYHPAVRAALARALESGEPFTIECRMIARSGREFWAELRCVGRVDDPEEGSYLTGTLQDISERKRFEQLLDQQAARFRSILQTASDGLHVLDMDGWLHEASDSFYRMLGYQRGDTDRLNVRDWDARYSASELAEWIPRLAEGFEIFETRHRRRDGSIFDVEVSATGVELDGERFLFASSRDISDRKRAEQALRESQDTLRRAQHVARVGSWRMLDSVDHYEVSDEFRRIAGFSDDEAISLESWYARVHPEDRSAIQVAWQETLGGAPFDHTFRLLIDGQVTWIRSIAELVLDASGAVQSGLGTVQDITELQLIRLDLERQEVRLKTVLENSPSGLALFDAERGLLLHNRQYSQLLGLADDLMAQPELNYDIVLHRRWERGDFPEFAEWEPLRDQVMRSLASRQPVVFSRPNRDGRMLETHAIPVPDGGLLMCYIDTTELTEVRHNLEQLNRDLEVRTREAEAANVAKSEFLANMSHEIRTPMNAILGLAQLLQKDPLSAEQRRMVQRIHTAGNNLLGILNDILDFSKLNVGGLHLEQRPFAPASVFAHVSSLLAPLAEEKGLILDWEGPRDLQGFLMGDARRLEQVLTNLLGNAIKFTHQGTVRLRMQQVATDERSLRLHVEVSDTGIGISPAQLAELGKPFKQADASISRRFGGTGLGLAITRQLLERMGGSLTIDSRLGIGSTFAFDLSFARASGAQQAPADVAAAPGVTGSRLAGRSILVVEDNEMNRDVVERALRREGAVAKSAQDGQQAIDVLRLDPKGFDAVLMDIQMPVLDGLAATRAIRGELGLKDLPIIAFSAGVFPNERREAMESGLNDFITKPVDLEDMIAVLWRWTKGGDLTDQSTPPLPVFKAPSDFPAIDGLDVARAAVLLGDDRTLFLTLLRRFADGFSFAASQTREDLAAGRIEEATRRLHTLRGIAGNIGATDLAETAQRLEAAIASGQPGPSGLLDRFEAELGVLLTGIGPWLTESQTGEDQEIGRSGPPGAAELAALREALQRQNLAARRLFTELKPALVARYGVEMVEALSAAIQKLRFREALDRLDSGSVVREDGDEYGE